MSDRYKPVNYYEQVDLKDLTTVEKKLFEAAKENLGNAYQPYSKFQVAAALLWTNWKTYVWTNFENAAYPLAICAERTTLAMANNLDRQRMFSHAVIIGRPDGKKTEKATAPCGACRQAFWEKAVLAQKDLIVIFSNTDMTDIRRTTISRLLPWWFGPDDLGIDLEKYR